MADESNRRTMFECEDCKEWFTEMEDFIRHPCVAGRSSTTNTGQQEAAEQAAETDNSQLADVEDTAGSVDTIVWTRPNTLLLIIEIGKRKALTDTGKLKKKDMFCQVAGQLQSKGYQCSGDQVANKWKSLLRGYKSIKDNNRKTGSMKKTHPYENELDSILATDPNVAPVHTSSSSSLQTENEDQGTKKKRKLTPLPKLNKGDEDKNIGSDDDKEKNESSETPKIKKPKVTQASQLVTFLHDYVEKQDRRHEDEAKKNEMMHNQKMEMLKSLVETLKK